MLGDAIGAGIVYHLSKQELERMDQLEDRSETTRDDQNEDIELHTKTSLDTMNHLENGNKTRTYSSDTHL